MIERTVLEIAQHRFWAWQRRTAPTPRNQLREIKLIPTHIWRRIVHLLGQLDGPYTERLGIDRSVERTAEVLFLAQEDLMVAARSHRRVRGGNVIPLFRS